MQPTTLAVAEPEIWKTIPGAGLIHVIEAFKLCGVDVSGSLAGFGMPEPLRNDTPLQASRVVEWLEHVLEAHPQRGFGLLFSRVPNLLDHGLVGYTILSSDTVGEAMTNRIRFAALLRPYFGLRLQLVGDDLAELVLLERDPPGVGPRLRAFAIEHDLAAWAGAFERALGPGPHFVEVHCAYPDPQLRDRYHDVFRCPVRYGAPGSLLRFKRSTLDEPLPHAHGEAHRVCEAQCEQLLAQLEGGGQTTAALQRLLLRRPRRLPDLVAAAAGLGMTERTLRRRLHGEGTSFSAQLSQARMLLARDYLRSTQIPVADIASLLGFADESSLSRAFGRRHGLTPRQYRARASRP
jgi:AraC-like DNA-binding protein